MDTGHKLELTRTAEVNVAIGNRKGNVFVKQVVVAVVFIFMAWGVASIVAAQPRPVRDVSASDLKQQLPLLFAQFILPVPAQSRETGSRTAFARGHGSIVSVIEKRQVYAALVVLRQNGKAVITLYSDLQLQVQGTWSMSDSSSHEIQLKITGLEVDGSASGSGKVLLSNDRKHIRELMITSKLLNGPEVTARFTADRSDVSQHDTNPILMSSAAMPAKTAVRVRSETIPLVSY